MPLHMENVRHQQNSSEVWGILILRLSETSTGIPSKTCHPKTSPYLPVLYVSTAAVTFNAGVLFFVACEFLRHTLRRLIG